MESDFLRASENEESRSDARGMCIIVLVPIYVYSFTTRAREGEDG